MDYLAAIKHIESNSLRVRSRSYPLMMTTELVTLDETVIGAVNAVVKPLGTETWVLLEGLWIATNWRRRGLATALIQIVEFKTWQDTPRAVIVAAVGIENTASQRTFDKVGGYKEERWFSKRNPDLQGGQHGRA